MDAATSFRAHPQSLSCLSLANTHPTQMPQPPVPPCHTTARVTSGSIGSHQAQGQIGEGTLCHAAYQGSWSEKVFPSATMLLCARLSSPCGRGLAFYYYSCSGSCCREALTESFCRAHRNGEHARSTAPAQHHQPHHTPLAALRPCHLAFHIER